MWGEESPENVAIIGGRINGEAIGLRRSPAGSVGGDKLIAIRVGKNLLFKDITREKGWPLRVYPAQRLRERHRRGSCDQGIPRRDRFHGLPERAGFRLAAVHRLRGFDTLGIKSDYALGCKVNTGNVYAWDCYFESGCNGLQFGSETAGDFHNVNIWNIRIGRAMKAGIGITSNDGGVIDGVNYRDITIKGAASPIYMLLTARLRSGVPDVKVGAIKNVKISNVTVTDCQPGRQGPVFPATISGRPDGEISNILLENVKITYKGGGTAAEADIIPPYPKDYSPRSLGPRPGVRILHPARQRPDVAKR